jgi:hypothetical protein
VIDPLAPPRQPRWREIATDTAGWLIILALCGALAFIIQIATGEA